MIALRPRGRGCTLREYTDGVAYTRGGVSRSKHASYTPVVPIVCASAPHGMITNTHNLQVLNLLYTPPPLKPPPLLSGRFPPPKGGGVTR